MSSDHRSHKLFFYLYQTQQPATQTTIKVHVNTTVYNNNSGILHKTLNCMGVICSQSKSGLLLLWNIMFYYQGVNSMLKPKSLQGDATWPTSHVSPNRSSLGLIQHKINLRNSKK